MTSSEQPKEIGWIFRHLPLLGGLSGVAALCTIFWSYALLPTRVAALEEGHKSQEARLSAIEIDNSQRREALATALALIQQIDSRTRRIEDHLIPPTK